MSKHDWLFKDLKSKETVNVLEKFKDACKFFGGECYEHRNKIFCEPFLEVRISVRKDNLETKVVDETAGLIRWDYLKDVTWTSSFGNKLLYLKFRTVPEIGFEITSFGVGYMGVPPKTYGEKLKFVAPEFKEKYEAMVKRAWRARMSRVR